MERFSNDAQSTLNGAITNVATSLVVASATGFPTAAPFRIRVENEIILVGAVSGTTFSTLTRGAEGTAGAAHANAVVVEHVLTAGALEGAFARLGPIAAQTLQAEADVIGLTIKEKSGGQTADLFRINDASNRALLRLVPSSTDQDLVLGPGDPAKQVHLVIDKGSAKYSGIRFMENGILHWYMDHDSGDAFGLNRYDDATGAYIANVFAIQKNSGHFYALAGVQAENNASVFSIGTPGSYPTDAKFDVRDPSGGPLYGARFSKAHTLTNAPLTNMSLGAISTGTAADGFGPGIWFQIGSADSGTPTATLATLWVVREGADTQGGFRFNTTTSNQERMRISQEGNIGINGSSFGGGVKVIFIGNAGTIPSTNPAAGGVLYAENGALKWRGSSGTVTQLAVA